MSPPRSPPETPKQKMAVDNSVDSMPPPSYDKRGKGKSQGNGSNPALKEDPSQEIQVPSSDPRNRESGTNQHEVDEATHDDQDRDPRPPQDEIVQPKPSEETLESSVDINIAEMDWPAFEKEYNAALAKAEKEDGELFEEFENLAAAFTQWIEASSGHDNERAIKRLKTRVRFVELSEQKLMEKKKRYIEVVSAFKQVMELLRA